MDQAQMGPLHVFDLPQLYQRPPAQDLLDALSLLTAAPPDWNAAHFPFARVDPAGVPEYLTRIIASPLKWIPADASREAIWEAASVRLSERSGRTAMGDLTRAFMVPVWSASGLVDVEIKLHEPALTGDDLGLKTWASSYVLAKKLHAVPFSPIAITPCACAKAEATVIDDDDDDDDDDEEATATAAAAGTRRATTPAAAAKPHVLELGAGTGLVGLAAAAAWRTPVLMTDLPSILPNLRRNAVANGEVLRARGAGSFAVRGDASVCCAALDWTSPERIMDASWSPPAPLQQQQQQPHKARDDGGEERAEAAAAGCKSAVGLPDRFRVILAADPIYSPDHPALLVRTVDRWLARERDALLMLAYPVREAYAPQIRTLREQLRRLGMGEAGEEVEAARDDWADEVTVVTSRWRWAEFLPQEP